MHMPAGLQQAYHCQAAHHMHLGGLQTGRNQLHGECMWLFHACDTLPPSFE